jgi:hypothetical protein
MQREMGLQRLRMQQRRMRMHRERIDCSATSLESDADGVLFRRVELKSVLNMTFCNICKIGISTCMRRLLLICFMCLYCCLLSVGTQAWVQLVWFFTPEQTPLGGGTSSGSKAWRRQYHAREVFLSTHTDANLAEVILGPALILPGAAYHWVDAATRNSNDSASGSGSGVGGSNSGNGVSGSGSLGAKISTGGGKSASAAASAAAAAAVISSSDIAPADKLDVRRALQSASAAAAALAAATASKQTKTKSKKQPQQSQQQSGKKAADAASSSDIVDNEVWRLVGCSQIRALQKQTARSFQIVAHCHDASRRYSAV